MLKRMLTHMPYKIDKKERRSETDKSKIVERKINQIAAIRRLFVALWVIISLYAVQ